jgi:acyl-[acyl-carrier-protein]-phospholipid O-acyltransferase/long-chain-fatty-acid--[acyl-carrier-protein] ligase
MILKIDPLPGEQPAMIVAQLALLASRRFLPLLLVHTLSTAFLAFVVTLLALRYGATADGEIAVALAACLVVPVLALVGSWGYQADRRPKAQILQWCLAFAIGLGFLIAAERSELRWLALDAVPLGLGLGYVLVAKVGLLGERLEEDQLVAANGWMFVAGGLGLVAGVALASAFADESPTRTMIAMGLGAAAFLPTLFLGPATVAPPETAKPDSLNPLSALAAAFRAAREVRGVRLSILGLAWAWFVAAALAALAPGYGKTVLGLDGEADLCLVGVTAGAFVLGALLCHPLLRGKISAAYVPLAAVAATLALFDLSWAFRAAHWSAASPSGLQPMLHTPNADDPAQAPMADRVGPKQAAGDGAPAFAGGLPAPGAGDRDLEQHHLRPFAHHQGTQRPLGCARIFRPDSD